MVRLEDVNDRDLEGGGSSVHDDVPFVVIALVPAGASPVSLSILLLVGGCAREAGLPPFGTTPGHPPGSTSTSGSSTSGSSTGGEGSSTSTGEHAGGSASTTVIYDVGSDDETGSSQPEGCKGKIDFLFVISRRMGSTSEGNGTAYDRLVAAAPSFFSTIETKFADFDYHILVTDGDPDWGSSICDGECPGPFTNCKVPDEYPCDVQPSTCDLTWGAGVVFNAGWLTQNKPCDIAGGKRYLAKGQPNLAETFTCLALVGGNGYDLIGQALTSAVSPELRAPGGCNEGFLRDDALLVVTLITSGLDQDSQGTPSTWAQALIDAKGGDPNAIVMLSIAGSEAWCSEVKMLPPKFHQPLCELAEYFPYRVYEDCLADDFGPAFDAATDLVAEACSSFIPS